MKRVVNQIFKELLFIYLFIVIVIVIFIYLFEGTIPSELGSLNFLQGLYLYSNSFEGIII